MMYMIYLKINEDIYPDPGVAASAVAILISMRMRRKRRREMGSSLTLTMQTLKHTNTYNKENKTRIHTFANA